MVKRMVFTDEVEVLSVLISSVFEIGDVYRFAPFSKVLAVQKEGSVFQSDPFRYEDFSIFARESSPPLPPVDIDTYHYPTGSIHVDRIRIIGVSTASALQIGGIDHIDSVNYTKHFRILLDER
ncbi:spore germination protein GerPE [Halobacillus sp. ACCC02827]|uniref:spore germination protein GerPE n=1 Tax=unclassified Halobacillus TaxID=2636472 RepID=UPI0007828A14|nr:MULTISPECIES: spore germination protein GerPE [unclassified Halobacillus]WJE16813.1 spore germination protein GerPE [Halobacillus sp. ACCC02827]